MSDKIRVAIVGYGNIGRYALEAANSAPDFEIAGVVRRSTSELTPVELLNIKVVDDIKKLDDVDVAILSVPSRKVSEYANEILNLGINTVDSFDIHSSIWDLKSELDCVAKDNNVVSVISAGWDPGSDSMIRGLLYAIAPKGITYTNFGPGMSMGHTVAVKAIEGVKAALSMTIPAGSGVHKRMVYVEIKDGYSFEDVESKIKNDAYFINDDTHVIQVADVNEYMDAGHGVNITRKGVSGTTPNQLFDFNMKINNPALTGQMLVASARATMRQNPGCYTLIEIPIIDYIYGKQEDLIKKLV